MILDPGDVELDTFHSSVVLMTGTQRTERGKRAFGVGCSLDGSEVVTGEWEMSVNHLSSQRLLWTRTRMERR